MFGSGDVLEVQLFFWGGAIAVAALIAGQMGWRHRTFIAALYITLAILTSLGVLWNYIVVADPDFSFRPPAALPYFLITSGSIYYILHKGQHESKSNVEQRSTEKAIPVEFAAFDRTNARRAIIKLRAIENISAIDVSVEYSMHAESVLAGSRWTQPRRVFLHSFEKMLRNEILSCQLFESILVNNIKYWSFGDRKEGGDFINAGGGVYRCRVVLSDSLSREKYYYFCASMDDANKGPTVIGEHLFDHMQTWENKEGRNPNVDSLYTYQ